MNQQIRIKPSLAEDASPDEYAAAMVRCQGYAPSCSDANECFLDGDCFAPVTDGYAAAKRSLRRLIAKTENNREKDWLQAALAALRAMKP